MEINIHEAKTHLSRLLEMVQAGEEVVIAKSGRPIAKLVPIRATKPVLGSARGLGRLKPGWDDPFSDEEIVSLFGQD